MDIVFPVIPIRDRIGMFDEKTLFSDPVDVGWFGRVSIMFSCLRLACFMGFNEIFLVGVDCTHRDGVHADGSRGFGNPLWDEDMKRYAMVRDCFSKRGVQVMNCTVGGDLEVFPRKSLEEVIG